MQMLEYITSYISISIKIVKTSSTVEVDIIIITIYVVSQAFCTGKHPEFTMYELTTVQMPYLIWPIWCQCTKNSKPDR